MPTNQLFPAILSIQPIQPIQPIQSMELMVAMNSSSNSNRLLANTHIKPFAARSVLYERVQEQKFRIHLRILPGGWLLVLN